MHLPIRIFFAAATLAASPAIPCLTPLPAGAAAAPPNACTVVSKAAAAKALGTPIASTSARSIGPSVNCTLKGTGFFKSVVVTTFRWNSVTEARSAFHSMVATTAQMMKPSIVLHGLGDEAQQLGPNVYVRKGTAAYVFNVIDGSTGAAKAGKTLALAKSAMASIR